MRWLVGAVIGLCAVVVPSQVPGMGPGAPGTTGYYEARQTHGAVEVMTVGEGIERVYVFLPAQPSVQGKVPLVMFLHGWQGMNPKNYGALLDHLAREGQVVVYPVYQESDTTNPQIVAAVAAEAERKALAALKLRGIEPDPERVVDFGYSMGVAISLRLAATAKAERLPVPQAMVLAAPGDAYHVAHGAEAKSIWPTVEEMRQSFAKTMPVAIVTGADDHAIGLPTGRKLAAELCGVIAADRRMLLVLPSDEHGGKKVNAGHASPGAPDSRYGFELKVPAAEVPKVIQGRAGFEESASLNQLDFYGYWRVMDALIDAVASRPIVAPQTVFGKGEAQTYLGTWADGIEFKRAHVESPCAR